ncbi:putative subtilisin-like protease, fibronectin type-III domain-containing protein [Helianthus anomalus]
MKLATKEINYPSMAVQVVAGESFVVSFPRSVTNVGRANSTYVAFIERDCSKLQVSVEPNTLQFTTMIQIAIHDNEPMWFIVVNCNVLGSTLTCNFERSLSICATYVELARPTLVTLLGKDTTNDSPATTWTAIKG